MNAQTEMTRQQDRELLAEWMGIDGEWRDLIRSRVAEFRAIKHTKRHAYIVNGKEWDPSPTGNSDDFLNMVAGRVDIKWFVCSVEAHCPHTSVEPQFELFPNDATDVVKTAAMKHAAYQVCLMAAREWKEAAR